MSQSHHSSRVPLIKSTARLPLLTVLAAAVLLASCASPPVPVVPDGSSRVTVNDPARIAAIQQKVTEDRTALTESNVIKAQFDDMRNQINAMRDLLRSALSLPPLAAPVAAPAPPVFLEQKNKGKPGVPPSPDAQEITTSGMPARSYEIVEGGAVVRVFYAYGKTQFSPTDEVSRILLESAKTAKSIEIRGLTDNNKVNNADREIARARAVNAWRWLVARGVDPVVILTRYQSAGNYLVANNTPAGRAMNRRAEIEMRGDALKTFVFVDANRKETL